MSPVTLPATSAGLPLVLHPGDAARGADRHDHLVTRGRSPAGQVDRPALLRAG